MGTEQETERVISTFDYPTLIIITFFFLCNYPSDKDNTVFFPIGRWEWKKKMAVIIRERKT